MARREKEPPLDRRAKRNLWQFVYYGLDQWFTELEKAEAWRMGPMDREPRKEVARAIKAYRRAIRQVPLFPKGVSKP